MVWVVVLNLALSITAFSQSLFPFCALKSPGTNVTICGLLSSNDIAYCNPRPDIKFRVGEKIASTSVVPVLKRYIRYSRQGEFFPGMAWGASAGAVALMADNVCP